MGIQPQKLVFENDKICKLKQIKTKNLISESEKFIDLISKENGDLCYCSIVPYAEKFILKALHRFEGSIHAVSPIFVQESQYPIIIRRKLDLIELLMQLQHIIHYRSPVVIDLGTATTFDIVTKEGGYEGGIILPGPQGFLDFLNENTALLPKVELLRRDLWTAHTEKIQKMQCWWEFL